MGAEGVGSGVIIALAAVLWLAYLVPTWLQRREYLATERNALRLQQTLRIMAETSEVPLEVRAETTARSAAQQERVLKKQLQRTAAIAEAQDAAVARAAARRLAETQPAIAADVAASSPASRRLRRSRAITSAVLFAALITSGFGVVQLLASGSWMLLAVGAAVTAGSIGMLGQMASVGRTRAALARSLRSRPVVVEAPRAVVAPPAPVQTTWTPVPVPKPLYMSRPAPERSLVASLEAAAELRQAAADAERRLREAYEAPEVTPIRPAAPTVPSRFARMGFVEEQPETHTDLDAVLRRRRA
ncbi:hypothetical protein [Frigoribacterium sp. UYMn621]|uniref:hypothetical protein n=1 Tax=Frigoribacterium sp. UYMn621 TaxID=3156343 RepID=UPI003399FD6F